MSSEQGPVHAPKVGLALSGGGFRASLFHIGVLARLAELDLLRRVEVLSCVSGGSIVGAHYYLKVRHLINEHDEKVLDRAAYLKLVEELAEEFLEGLDGNLRMRLLTSPRAVLHMVLSRKYSRTLRAGELYERQLYALVHDGEQNEPRTLPKLFIHPPGEPNFAPKTDNWRRQSKVPILVINATTLNTGHNWQYTASWMGEPPDAIDQDVDSSDRLRRMYHYQAPEGHRETRLGHAVAASASVPGLFAPVTLADLYDDITVQLADGGVHDNQGIASLLDQKCSVILVSDASGQRTLVEHPWTDPLRVLARSGSIQGARVRQAEFADLAEERRSSRLRGLMFVHLREDLPREDRPWKGAADTEPGAAAPGSPRSGTTSYGIRVDVQARLAEIRTDLDAFSRKEAYALMASGYRMVERAFEQRIVEGFSGQPPRHPWSFCAVQDAVQGGAGHGELLEVLRVGAGRFLKPQKLSSRAALATMVLAALTIAGLVALVLWQPTAAIVALVLLAVSAAVVSLTDNRKGLWAAFLPLRLPLAIVAPILGPLIAWIYLLAFNRWYLRLGAVPEAPRTWSEETTT